MPPNCILNMRTIVFCLLALVLCPCMLQAQQKSAIDSIFSRFIDSVRAGDGEEVSLETDRNVYASGETIWFSALLMDELYHKVDTSSKNLFVDLVTDKDSVVNKLVLDAVHLRTTGYILLNDSIPSGCYWLRCYTQHIITTTPEAAFIKPLYVINRQHGNSLKIAGVNAGDNKNAVIHFYPEGGALITGKISTGAIQVTTAQGSPLIIQGNIVADQDSVVASFTTNKFGLAKVGFYPVWYKKYRAVVHYNGNDITYDLPPFNFFSAQISVTGVMNQSILVGVALEDSIYSRRYTTYLMAVNGDKLCYASIGQGMYTATIPTENMVNGVTSLLLFNSKYELLSQRKIFIQKPQAASIITNKQTYAERENVTVNVDIKDAAGNPLIAAINIAVQDNKIMTVCDELDADSTLPIAAGQFNNWFYKHAATLPAQDVDLFMLAHKGAYNYTPGVRTGTYRYADSNNTLLNITGTITDKEKNGLMQKIVTVMSGKTGDMLFDADTTGFNGAFSIPIPANVNNTPVMVQVTNKRGIAEPEDYINIDYFKFPSFTTPAVLKRRFTAFNAVAAQQLAKYTNDTFYNYIGKGWLKPVVVTAVAKAAPNYDVSKRLSPFSRIITSDKLGHGGPNEIGYSLFSIPGIQLIGGKVTIHGMTSRRLLEPLLVVDGIAVNLTADSSSVSPLLNYLNTFNYDLIDFIEVLEGPEAAIYGTRGAAGVIAVFTKIPEHNSYSPGFKTIRPVTYHSAPLFTMPDYADKKIKNNKQPDPRTTIYWQGNIVTGKDGKATASFFTADGPATYAIIITGVTQNGQYIYKRMNISVK